MDAKITKVRLSRMLSYDWLKIVGLCLAAILVWSLVFTMTETRITPAQEFYVFNHSQNLSFTQTNFDQDYNKALDNGVFSHEVLENAYADLTMEESSSAGTLLSTRMATSQGDLIFIPPLEDSTYQQQSGYAVESYTCVESFALSWGSNLVDLDEYFSAMESYLNRYYQGDWTNENNRDDAKIEADFRARVTANKDKRYRKEEKLLKGIKDDIERIEKYRDALEKFNEYVASGYVEFVEVTCLDAEKGEPLYYSGKKLALNICPDESKMGNLKEVVAYAATDETSGNTYKTAKDMHISFIRFKDEDANYRYENLLYVNYLLDTYSTK